MMDREVDSSGDVTGKRKLDQMKDESRSGKSTLENKDRDHEESGSKRQTNDDKDILDEDNLTDANMKMEESQEVALSGKVNFEKEEKIKELEQVIEDLKKKLQSKDSEMRQMEMEEESLRCGLRKRVDELVLANKKQEGMVQQILEKLECPVCMHIPRSGPVPVCPNGHFVCSKCKTDSCPTCRTVMGGGKSLLASTVLENIEHRCKFDDCEEKFALEDIEQHEAICSHRIVNCPGSCIQKVPLSKLVDHWKVSTSSCSSKTPKAINLGWNRLNFCTNVELSRKNMNWPPNVFTISTNIHLIIFPTKSEGQFYFIPVMTATEVECQQYYLEVVVHDQQTVVGFLGFQGTDMCVRFQGSPLSIDTEKIDQKLYGTNEPMMTKIMSKSIPKNSFGMSFKLTRKRF